MFQASLWYCPGKFMSHKELNRQLCAVGLPAMSLGEKPGGGGLWDMGVGRLGAGEAAQDPRL